MVLNDVAEITLQFRIKNLSDVKKVESGCLLRKLDLFSPYTYHHHQHHHNHYLTHLLKIHN